MMVEPGLEGRKKQVLASQEGGGSSRKGKRRQKKKAVQTAVQRLYLTCKDVFSGITAGIVPPPEEVGRIQYVLDDMKPSDVGRTIKLPSFGIISPSVAYMPIYDCPKFTIAVFLLPPSGVIPLHNHPGMTVFSKLLAGSMHIKSYDWVDAPQNSAQNPRRRLAKVKIDTTLTTPCDTNILYPADGGNMHCFTAKTACVVLDVLGPPYSDPDGRHCQYYRAFPCSSSGDAATVPGDGEYALLEEKPQDFRFRLAEYDGPKVVEQ